MTDNHLTDQTKLLPCPFCHGDAQYGEIDRDGQDFRGQFIQCMNAMCETSSALIFPCGDDPKPLLAMRWNRRVTPVAHVTQLLGALSTAEAEARRYASHYPHGSDGRNTFTMLADRIADLKDAASR